MIANYAGKLWQQIGKSKESCEALITQLRFYKEQEQYINGNLNPYVTSYAIGSDTPLMWWNTCEVKPNYLQRLAIKLFSITPSSAACERIFSSLGWYYGNRRTNLEIECLEGLAKIYRFNLSNPIEQLRCGQISEVTSEIMECITETVYKEFEEENLVEEAEEAELANSIDDLYSNEPDLNLDVFNIVDLHSLVFSNSNEIESFSEAESDNSYDENYNYSEEDLYDVDEIITRQLG
jgi:hypothetical protein